MRCPWAEQADDLRRYHDEEWGRPVHGDAALFERLSLEGFQSGLSWLTILRKRDAFRAAFRGFDPNAVSGMDGSDIERLMGDAGIVRNRHKIEATIDNARVLVAWQQAEGVGVLDELVWSVAKRRARPRSISQVRSTSPESLRLSSDLRGLGFRFVGPTTVYSLMQACGVVDDHLAGCDVPNSAR